MTAITGCATTDAQPAAAQAATAPARNIVRSTSDFASTDARLKAAIESRGLTLFTIVDHAAGAATIDLTLAPTKLYIFGNPRAGTPLMQANQAIGLDLPLKALVYETDEGVFVATPNIDALTAEYGIDGLAQLKTNVGNALGGIAAEAAGTAG